MRPLSLPRAHTPLSPRAITLRTPSQPFSLTTLPYVNHVRRLPASLPPRSELECALADAFLRGSARCSISRARWSGTTYPAGAPLYVLMLKISLSWRRVLVCVFDRSRVLHQPALRLRMKNFRSLDVQHDPELVRSGPPVWLKQISRGGRRMAMAHGCVEKRTRKRDLHALTDVRPEARRICKVHKQPLKETCALLDFRCTVRCHR